MSNAKKIILVAGDVTVDWFLYPVGATDDRQNWRLHSSFHSNALPDWGGGRRNIRRSLSH